MMNFLKVLNAQIAHRNQALLWGISRGWKDTPHKAAGVTVTVSDNDTVTRCLVHECYISNEHTFPEFLRRLKLMHLDIYLAAVAINDTGTRADMAAAKIKSLHHPMKPIEAELLIPAGLSVKDLTPYEQVINAAASLALTEADGLTYV